MSTLRKPNGGLVLSATLLCFGLLSCAAQAQKADEFQAVVDKAHAKYLPLQDGANADYIPILTVTPSDLFGVVIVTKDGKVCAAGDVDYKFSIQSVSKPFTAALVMNQQGTEAIREKIGVEPTVLSLSGPDIPAQTKWFKYEGNPILEELPPGP